MTTPWVHHADEAKFPPGVEGTLNAMFSEHAVISLVSYDSSCHDRSIDRVMYQIFAHVRCSVSILTANDLKEKGVSSIEKLRQEGQEVIISVHGKPCQCWRVRGSLLNRRPTRTEET